MNFAEQLALKSNDELVAITADVVEYDPKFIDLAYQELSNRGIDTSTLRQTNAEKAGELEKSLLKARHANPDFLLVGFIFAFLGGVIGFCVGYYFSQSKVPGPSGSQFYLYDEKTREKGRIMIVVSLFVMAIIMAIQYI